MEYQQFLKHFHNIQVVTNHNKLRSFQYRLLTYSIVTSRCLKRWNIIESDLCTFCNLQEETIIHLLYLCPKVQPLWSALKEIAKNYRHGVMNLTLHRIIWNLVNDDPSHIINFLVLFAAIRKTIYI